MSFLEFLGLPDPRKIAREARAECTDPVVLANLDPMVRNAEARLAPWLHDAVRARVRHDPGLLALTDQFAAEFAHSARRGRRV